jgi:transposase
MNDTMIHEIVLRFRGGASMRQIARSLHVSRCTVRRVLDQVDQARIAGPAPEEPKARPRHPSLDISYADRRLRMACII